MILALATFLWRFLVVPWDAGGFVLQLGLLGASVYLVSTVSALARIPLYALSLLALLGTLYVAASALIPVVGILLLPPALYAAYREGHQIAAVLVALVLLPLLATFSVSSLRHMATLFQFRTLDPATVTVVKIGGPEAVEVRDPEAVAEIVEALQNIYPYSPNHESIGNPRTLRIKGGGRSFHLRVGDGNRTHPDAVWVEFPGNPARVYQCVAMSAKLGDKTATH